MEINQLSLESQVSYRALEVQVEKMTSEQLRHYIMELYRLYLFQQKFFKDHFKGDPPR